MGLSCFTNFQRHALGHVFCPLEIFKQCPIFCSYPLLSRQLQSDLPKNITPRQLHNDTQIKVSCIYDNRHTSLNFSLFMNKLRLALLSMLILALKALTPNSQTPVNQTRRRDFIKRDERRAEGQEER